VLVVYSEFTSSGTKEFGSKGTISDIPSGKIFSLPGAAVTSSVVENVL